MICRLCRARIDEAFIDLGETPLSNALVDERDAGKREPAYPLRAYVCGTCWLVQVPEVQPPETIFGNYVYFSSYSTTWLEHVTRFAREAMERFALSRASLVIEIASNDGHLLRSFAHAGIGVLGIEPARNIAEAATQAGIPTEVAFFGSATATRLADSGTRADLVVGNNVLAHVPDTHDFAEGLRIVLKADGVISLEFPHVLRMLERGEFDTIYHEHFSYFSLATAARLLSEHGLEVFDAEELPTHGGSLRVLAAHRGRRAAGSRPSAIIEQERAAGLTTMEPYRRFAARAEATKRDLLAFFERCKSENRTVAGYGAPAKATTLLNYCGIGPAKLPYTVDRSPHKQGKYVPGVRVPIAAPAKLLETKPDYVLVLPWNIKEEIAEQMAVVKTWGGRFVVPIPKVALL